MDAGFLGAFGVLGLWSQRRSGRSSAYATHFDVDVGLVGGTVVVEDAHVGRADVSDNRWKEVTSSEVAVGPSKVDSVRRQQMREIEAQGILDSRQEAMTHEADERTRASTGARGEALEKRKAATRGPA